MVNSGPQRSNRYRQEIKQGRYMETTNSSKYGTARKDKRRGGGAQEGKKQRMKTRKVDDMGTFNACILGLPIAIHALPAPPFGLGIVDCFGERGDQP